jgi:hypothetical protein
VVVTDVMNLKNSTFGEVEGPRFTPAFLMFGVWLPLNSLAPKLDNKNTS